MALTLLGAVPAKADPSFNTREGVTTFGVTRCLAGHCAPQGLFSISYDYVGSGGHMPWRIRSGFEYAGNVCNWWIDFEATHRGVRTFHSQGGEQRCTWKGSRTHVEPTLPSTWLPSGNMCAILYRDASGGPTEVKRACVAIDPE
ncbi:hypothetical protein ACIBSW_34035 [Actinoplanes sp. NPDC049668]|uniref:hypothetical protein n=1 Tax=unclassified Actinoplanes TaxID=2626549 RepID=UPI0033B5EBD7